MTATNEASSSIGLWPWRRAAVLALSGSAVFATVGRAQTDIPCPAVPNKETAYVVAGTGVQQPQYVTIVNPFQNNRDVLARIRVAPFPIPTATKGTDFRLDEEDRDAPKGTAFLIHPIETYAERPPVFPVPSPPFFFREPNFDHALFEIFAAHAYDDWREGDSVEDKLAPYYGFLPGRLGYRVARRFEGPWDFQAFGFTSVEWFTLEVEWLNMDRSPTGVRSIKRVYIYDNDRPPVLAFRGTEPAHLADIFTDFDPIGVGYTQYDSNRQPVEDWLRCVSDPFKDLSPDLQAITYKPHLTGHSLGGALTQWFAAGYTALGGRLGQVVTFNSPGISVAASGRFNRNRADFVTHYVTSADLASLAGRALLRDGARNVQERVPNWVKSSYLTDQHLGVGVLLEKHSVPVILPRVFKDGEFKDNPIPPGRGRAYYGDAALWLNDPSFNYFPDPDYFGLLITLAQKHPVFRVLVAQMVFRVTVENVRSGRVLPHDAFLTLIEALDAWKAAKGWRSAAWEAIIRMSKAAVDAQGGQSAEQTLIARAAQTSGSATASNFWEAAAQWPPAAWQASVEWKDFAWQAMSDKWTAEQWAATVATDPPFPWAETPGWTAQQWQDLEGVPARKLRGTVYWDENANGQNNHEPGLPAVRVYLDVDPANGQPDSSEPQTLTQQDGQYVLRTTLPAGTYRLRQQVDPELWRATVPAGGERTVTFDANPGQEIAGLDFANECLDPGRCREAGRPPHPERTWITNDAFVQTIPGIRNGSVKDKQAEPKDTGISTKEYTCSVVGYRAQGGDIEQEKGERDIVYVYLHPKDPANAGDTTWLVSADLKTGFLASAPPFPYLDEPETWDVDLLCLSSKVASMDGPVSEKPFFLQAFPNLKQDIAFHDTGIKTADYVCGVSGFNSHAGDIQEKDKQDIIEVYLVPHGTTWSIRAHFAAQNTPSWDVNVLCASRKLATVGEPTKGKSVFLKELNDLGDNLDVDIGVSADDHWCGVVGFAALGGDINEDGADGQLLFAYTHEVGGAWYFRGDFRTQAANGYPPGRQHENWTNVKILCITRGDSVVPPNSAPDLALPHTNLYLSLSQWREISFEVTAEDVNWDEIRLFAESLPGGATFPEQKAPRKVKGTFRFTLPTLAETAWRDYPITFTAADQQEPVSQTVTVRVCGIRIADCQSLRYYPRIGPLTNKQAMAGQALTPFRVTATDKDEDRILLKVACNSVPVDPRTTRCQDGPVGAQFTVDQNFEGKASGVFTWTPDTPGTYPVKFSAYDTDAQGRRTEGSDHVTITITVTENPASLPDLTVVPLGWPASAAPGTTVNFTYMIKNGGTAAAAAGNGGFLTRLVVNGQPVPDEGGRVGSRRTPSLDAGGSSTNGFRWLAACGGRQAPVEYQVSAETDADRQVLEKVEGNNSTPLHKLVVDCTPPDLVVVPGSLCTQNRLCEGAPMQVHARIRNLGPAAAPGSRVNFGMYKSDCQVMHGPLGPEDSQEVTCSLTAPYAAEWALYATVDDLGQVAEANETNNQLVKTGVKTERCGSLPNRPDLSVRTIRTSPAPVRAGERVTIEAELFNAGTAVYPSGAETPFSEVDSSGRLVRSLCADWHSFDLAPGASTWVSCAAQSFASGSHHLKVEVQGFDEESSYCNNAATIKLNVGNAPVPQPIEVRSARPVSAPR